jgi:glyoxylase-like metal-dependent hydrolase (beta-lactamase superfamily II)/rhodanese-related sulfurtransferase
MMFKQIFDKNSCTYTYLIADPVSKEAVFIDPVDTYVEDYLALLKTLDLKLVYSFETHVHADHISGSGLLRQATGAQTCIGLHCGAEIADNRLVGGEAFTLGADVIINAIATPGHTPGSMSYLWADKVFTGDALFIGGCGRTDFQNGDPGDLYDAVTQKIFTLPGETLVYPGHDYKGDFVSCVYQESSKNPRLAGKTRDEFIEIMNNLNLPVPTLIDKAVPANLYCGIEEEVALQWANERELSNADKEHRGAQGKINYAKQQVNVIDVKTAQSLIADGDPVILDVREKNEFNLGHIEHAINLPRGEIRSDIESILATRHKDAPILIYCASGHRSVLAALVMAEIGYTNVISLTGGYVKWKRETS